MKIIDKSRPVAVTGGTGYIASWIVKYLLEQGYSVRASVRDKSDTSKYSHLTQIASASPGKLEIFEADLLRPGSFDAIADGCEVVIHTASPFRITGVKDYNKEVIAPALEGTRNVLGSVNRSSSVKRVVLTASVASIFGDAADIKTIGRECFSESDWNNSSTPHHQPYSYSKTVAEREAWRIAGEQERWDLVTIHPGFVLGPSLTSRTDSTSIGYMIGYMKGQFMAGSPDLWFGMVDVRDAAMMHILAAFNPAASGRYMSVGGSFSLAAVSAIMKQEFGNKYRVSARRLPKFFFYIVGSLMGFSIKFLKLNVGIPVCFDNSRSSSELGIKFRQLNETVRDHVNQIESSGLLKKR